MSDAFFVHGKVVLRNIESDIGVNLTYLGLIISMNRNRNIEITRRIKLARIAFGRIPDSNKKQLDHIPEI